MVAWLNIFDFIGFISPLRYSIAAIALVAGIINCKDFLFFKKGISLTIQEKHKGSLVQKVQNMMEVAMQMIVWLKAMRAPFFQAVIIPVILGTAIAWSTKDTFNLAYFLLALLGVVFVNAGTNLANDYFDHQSRADDINPEVTPFSGGSRVIQDGLLPAGRVYLSSLVFFGLACVIGLYLIYSRGLAILVIGIIGVLSGYFYTASPIKVGYRGWGELLAGINCGPLVVQGAYYVQTKALSLEALVVSIPVGLLITAVLVINQFPDRKYDMEAGKNTLVATIGLKRSLLGYYLLITFSYLLIILASFWGIIPKNCLISTLTIPLAWKAIRVASSNYTNTKELIPAMSTTIFIHLTVGLLLSSGYILTRIFT